MQYLDAGRTAHEPLRIVFDDRVVYLPLGPHATLADVARAIRDFGSRGFGEPVAVDVTMPASSARFRASGAIPAHLKYEDGPAAEFDFTVLPAATFTVPDRVSDFAV